MKLFLTLVLAIALTGFSQQRIGLDVNYRQTGLNVSISYHKVFATNWLISGAINFGHKGRYLADYRDFQENKASFHSPWSKVNEPILQENSQYELKRYSVKNRALTFKAGLGYFYNFGVKHGVRGHVFMHLGQSFNEVSGTYDASDQTYDKNKLSRTNHPIAAVSTEIYHTIQIWRKFTLFYGLKTPYYFTIHKSQFDPKRRIDNFNGFEPELTLGITYLIGDC